MSRTSRVLLAGATVALAAGLVPLGTVGATVGPAGNNGTVKIDGVEFDTAPDNEPHVGCTFEVDWYGFDANAKSDVMFELQAPTLGNPPLIFPTKQLDGDDNSGGGSEAGLDGQQEYDIAPLLSRVKAHPIQGYHVKLTINTQPTAQGADVKHKVFWVTGCRPGSSS